MKFTLLLAATLMLGFASPVKSQKRTVAGVTFPAKLSAGSNLLTYNGAGLREKFFIDLYVSALYLQETSMSGSKIVNADEAMAIRLEIISNKVTRDKFIQTVEDGFKKASSGKATSADISKMKELFSDPFSSGDVIKLAYVPGEGVLVYKNSKKLGAIGGLDFKKALFSIWLGETPADDGLKAAMLGKV